jgi:hypothetical protein
VEWSWMVVNGRASLLHHLLFGVRRWAQLLSSPCPSSSSSLPSFLVTVVPHHCPLSFKLSLSTVVVDVDVDVDVDGCGCGCGWMWMWMWMM